MKVLLLTACLGVLFLSAGGRASLSTFDIYFIDTDGGAATLIVTPSRESLLVDSGYPGERDAGRIAHVARDVAKLSKIDHYITTHFHRDHFGGIAELTRMIPVNRFYDHGIPEPLPSDIDATLVEAYRKASKGDSLNLKAGDEIRLKALRSTPVRLRVLASDGLVVGEPQGSPQIRVCGKNHLARGEDVTDNAKSIAFRLSFGSFKFFAGGDLTWNTEHKLVCPINLPGPVDVYLANHHGLDSSNNPALVNALNPRVAIINNGARKGAESETLNTLKSISDIAIFQLHRNVRLGNRTNAPYAFVANTDEACQGEFIKLSVASDERSYRVSLPGKELSYTFRTK